MDEERRQKITILLAEYNTLRAEVMAALGNVGQAAGIAAAAGMADFALYFSPNSVVPGWVAGVIAVAILVYFFWTRRME